MKKRTLNNVAGEKKSPVKMTDEEIVDYLRELNWNDPAHQNRILEVCGIIKKRGLLDNKYTSRVLNPPDPFRMDR